MPLYLRIYILALLTLLSFSASSQDCSISQQIQISSFDTTNLVLEVAGLTIDQLSGDQGICGVRLFFSHGQLENLRITLISPAGETVILVGPGTVNSGLTQLVNWNVLFIPCGTPPAPDAGFDGVWDNDQAWASLTTYDGVYHPNNGCLEDFVTGSANGTWTLQLENLGPIVGELEYFELIFCDSNGIRCEPCLINAGDFSTDFYTTCQQDLTLSNMDPFLDASPLLEDGQDYTFVLSESDNIIAFDSDMSDLDTLPPGFYSICGLAYDTIHYFEILEQSTLSQLNDLMEANIICADLTTPCFTLQITPVDHIVELDTTLCAGDTLSFLGIKIFDDIDTNILRANQITCDSLIIIHAEKITVEAVMTSSLDTVFCGVPVFLNANASSTDGDPLEYNWSTVDGNYISDLGPVVQVDQAGTYMLEVESSDCQDSIELVLESSDTFFMEIIADPIFCVDDTFSVSILTGISPDSVRIGGPEVLTQSNQDFTTLNSGTYNINAFFGSCQTTAEVSLVDQATPIDILVSSTVIDCVNPNSIVKVTTNATSPVFSYEGPETILDMLDSIEVGSPGIYTVTVFDENNCSEVQTFEILATQDVPDYVLSDLSRSCMDEFATLLLTINSPFDSVLWTGPNNYFSRELNPTASDEGVYYLEIFGTNGCVKEDSLQLSISNVPVDLDITSEINCLEETIILCASEIRDSLHWIYDNQIISRDSCTTVSEDGIYYLTVFSGFGCIGMDSVILSSLEENFFTINNIPENLNISCQESALTLSPEILPASAVVRTAWTLDGNPFSDQLQIDITTAGQYILEVENAAGCIQADTVDLRETIPFYEQLTITFDQQDARCFGDTTYLFVSGIDTIENYIFYLDGELVEYSSGIVLPEGPYNLLVEGSDGCTLEHGGLVTFPEELSLDLGVDITDSKGSSELRLILTNLEEDAIENFEWSDPSLVSCLDCLDPLVFVEKDTILSLMLTDTSGCTITDFFRITLIEEEILTDIYIPNVFSPDSDGDNSVFNIYHGDGITRVYDIRIYDRWGNLVFFRSEYRDIDNFIWDGRSQGKLLEQGVYVLRAKFTTITNIEKEIIVPITLLR